ncbi:MAG: molybdopterin-dependent oxidoreductase [Candidatus Binatia bacterium]
MKVSRREFLRIGSVVAGTVLYPSLVFSQLAEELPEFIKAAPFPLEEYPYRDWEEVYREQLKHDRAFPAHVANGRYIAHVRKDTVVRLEPWYGAGRLAGRNYGGEAKAYSQLRRLYSAARIKRPMLRRGFLPGSRERGSGEWEEVSWEKAYEIIARKVLEVMKSYGPESIKLVTGSLASGPVSKQGALVRFANMIGASVWLDEEGPLTPALEGLAAYYFENPENPGRMKRKAGFESPAGFISGREVQQTKIRWHGRHDFLTRTGSLYEIVKKRDPEVEMIVAQATEFDLTCEYADIVLPVHTWAEASLPDLAVIGPDVIDLAKGGIKPLHDSKMDIEITAGVARKMAEITKKSGYADYWKASVEDSIQRVLDGGSATGGLKVADFHDGPQPLKRPSKVQQRRLKGDRNRARALRNISVPKSRPQGSLYLVVKEGKHSFGPQWGLSDLSEVLSGNFGDPWKLDPRSPGPGEAELEVNPGDAKSMSIEDGDYLWVDPASKVDIDPEFRTLIRCKFNPGLPIGLVLVREGWHPAAPETKKALARGAGRARTRNGYAAHYRSGGIQYFVEVNAKLSQEEDNGLGYASLSDKQGFVRIAKAEEGNYQPGKSEFGVARAGKTMQRYLSGELSRMT